jgi:NAD(P)-dependent dehydrogenase (short-subunit alcohol dehydrogenase family)
MPSASMKHLCVDQFIRGELRMPGLPPSLHALVTGGGRGIGREIASVLAHAGATVTVLGRDRATLDDAVARGAAHFAAVADVADQAGVSAAIAQAAARQPIDILVANAGIAESAPFAKSDAALFRRMMDVNFMGVVHSIQARHSGAMRSIEPGISRFRVWSFGPSRNDAISQPRHAAFGRVLAASLPAESRRQRGDGDAEPAGA